MAATSLGFASLDGEWITLRSSATGDAPTPSCSVVLTTLVNSGQPADAELVIRDLPGATASLLPLAGGLRVDRHSER